MLLIVIICSILYGYLIIYNPKPTQPTAALLATPHHSLQPPWFGLDPPLPLPHTISPTSLYQTLELTTCVSRLLRNCILKTQFRPKGNLQKSILLVTNRATKIKVKNYIKIKWYFWSNGSDFGNIMLLKFLSVGKTLKFFD